MWNSANSLNWWVGRALRLLALTSGVVMSACASGDAVSWKEEVLLHDGGKIIVERMVERGGRHEFGQKPPIKEQSLTFTLPGSNQAITWEDKYSEDVGSANFLPMLLEAFKGTAYLVVYPMGCLSYNKWGRPNPPYIVFKYDRKAWRRIALQELPSEARVPNLVISSPDDASTQISQGLVSVGKIKELNVGFKQLEYQTILRTEVKGAGEGCPRLVRVEGGWVSPNGAKSPIPITPGWGNGDGARF